MGIMEGIVAIISIIALTILVGIIIICVGVNSQAQVENAQLRGELEVARKKILEYEYNENKNIKGGK